MKKSIITLCLFLTTTFGFSETTFDQTAAYQKLYNLLALPGDDLYSSDIPHLDLAVTDFIRQLFILNDLTADEVFCCWVDTGLPELIASKPLANNQMVWGFYERISFGISRCNEFLQKTATLTDATTLRQRAEARFLRALCYSYGIDMWGDMPLGTGDLHNVASRSTRKQVFEFIESELKNCVDEMAAPGTATYGTADQTAAWLLLARLYLNAQVYTGTPRWADAKTYAKKVTNKTSKKSLCSQYTYLFMGDNNTNGAQNEVILPLIYDSETRQSYGGMTYLMAATTNSNIPNIGFSQHWSGYYMRYSLLNKFFSADAPNVDVADMQTAAADERALFYGEDKEQGKTFTYHFNDGFCCVKYDNNPSTGNLSTNKAFADTDFPLMRMAEAYLILAEADARLNSGRCSSEGLTALNAIRTRAHAATLTSAKLQDICDEWAREFYLEGRRRSDLIRFGYYADASQQDWTYKCGTDEADLLPEFYKLMPVPEEILANHSGFVQNPGYEDVNFVPTNLTLNNPAFYAQSTQLKDLQALRFNWSEPSNNSENRVLTYALVLSDVSDLDDDDFISKETTETEIEYSALELNTWLIEQGYSDGQTATIYAKLMCHGVSSNVINFKVVVSKAFVLMPLYFTGNCIGDGNWYNSVYDLGASLFPMNTVKNATYDSNGKGPFTYKGYFSAGNQFKLIQDLGSWDNSLGSDDNSDNITFNNYGNISVPADGWYQIDVNNKTQTASMTKIATPSATVYNGIFMTLASDNWSLNNAMRSCNPNNPYNHMWYIRSTFENDTEVMFASSTSDSKWGATAFPYGYGQKNGSSIPVKAGNYIIFFDDLSGHYNFIDLKTLNNNLTWDETTVCTRFGKIKVTAVNQLNTETTAERLKVLTITTESGKTYSDLKLVVGDKELPINANGTVDKTELLSILNEVYGEYGTYDLTFKLTGSCLYKDLLYNAASESFVIQVNLKQKEIESAYYYIGTENNWLFNTNIPLTKVSSSTFMLLLTIHANETVYFSIFGESTISLSSDERWQHVYRPNEYGQMSGQFSFSGSNSFMITNSSSKEKQYRCTFDFNKNTYEFTDCSEIATAIDDVNTKTSADAIYNINGQRMNSNDISNLKKGIYIINGKKVCKQK